MRALAAAVLLLSRAVVADDAPSPDRGALPAYEYAASARALGIAFAPVNGFTGDVYAGATVEDRTTALTVGARLGTPGVAADCRFVEAEAAYHFVGDDRSATTSIGACLYRAGKLDVTAPGLAVRWDGGYALRPALSAPRTLLTRRYTGGRVRVEGSALEGTMRHSTAALFAYRVDVHSTAQDGRSLLTVDVATDAVKFAPPTLLFGDPRAPEMIVEIPADELAILGLFVRANADGPNDVMAGGLMLGRILGLRVGRGIALDAELRFGVGTVGRRAMPTGEPYRELASVLTPVGYVGATGALARLTWGARLTRGMLPTFDGAIALEDRLDGSIELRGLVPGLKLTAFTARTALYAGADVPAAWTGGATLARPFALSRHVSVVVSAEAARSWYAVLDGAAPRPAPAARVWAVMTGSLGR